MKQIPADPIVLVMQRFPQRFIQSSCLKAFTYGCRAVGSKGSNNRQHLTELRTSHKQMQHARMLLGVSSTFTLNASVHMLNLCKHLTWLVPSMHL